MEKYPNARYLFRFECEPEVLYFELKEFLRDNGYNFEIMGDKLPTLNEKVLEDLKNDRIIFTIRDIRTWLCKDSTIRTYITSQDIVPTVIDYCSYFLKSFLLPDVLHIRMEDIIYKNQKIIELIGNFLNVDLLAYSREWWTKVKNFEANHPKNVLGWQKFHYTSSMEPKKEDTITILNSHHFWDSLLPIFDKYYQNVNGSFKPEEIFKDIKELKDLIKFSPVSLKEVFKSYKSSRLGASKNAINQTKLEIIINRLRIIIGSILIKLLISYLRREVNRVLLRKDLIMIFLCFQDF